MDSRRNRVAKTSKRKKETRPWADLPQEILLIILKKSSHIVEKIRFRAVCKSWHINIPKDEHPQTQNHQPWLCHLSWSKGETDILECEIYDPNARRAFMTSEYVESHRYTRTHSKTVTPIGLKQGWLIAVYDNNHLKCEIFMYHPYRKEFISLPFILKYRPCFATFSGNPGNPESRVFVLLKEEYYPFNYFIGSYGLNGDKEWMMESLSWLRLLLDECCGIEYMNGQLLCLFRDGRDGRTVRYSLTNKSNKSVACDTRWQLHHPQLRLTKGEGDLLVACELDLDGLNQYRMECSTLYYDWSNMNWVRSDLQESAAIFISGAVSVFVRPFGADDKKSCKVFSSNDLKFSFVAAEVKKHWKYFHSTVFIEPPHIN